MGVPFRIVLYATNQPSAEVAAEAAFHRISHLNDLMSDYDPDSELSKLSQGSGQGLKVPVSPELWFVLKRAEELSQRSQGAFDVTVGPFVNLWRRARRQHRLPDPARLEQARQAVGYQKMRLDAKGRTVELLAPNMRLDLGGIAKGYAVDEALRTLRHLGIKQALVEGGGDVGVSDPPPGKKGWRFDLSSLDASNAPPDRFLLLKDAAISTSGDLYQRLEIDGKRYSHIVDPRTGIGLTDHSLVSVVARDSITADSLTKVVSVLGPEKGLKFIEATPGAAARIMREPGERIQTYESSRFHRYYENR
ncbi:MAG TPA: FAD:protein FMN transferase [Verrucomicrobiae bacterium]|nr:FAD:protein FMN transferase [Verrucomicrobiae bacterium]